MKFTLVLRARIWNDAKMFPLLAIAITTPFALVSLQHQEIQAPAWHNTSLAMIIDYYTPNAVSVNALLQKGVAAGAYENNVGWIYAGLIRLSKQYGLDGTYYDLSKLDTQTAFDRFKNYVKDGPVILSVHYKFDPKSTIPHLVVIDGVSNGIVYYNDPAAKTGEKQISVSDFLNGWKKKVIVIRPTAERLASATR